VALGNDRQFAGLCRMLELDGLATDPRFASTAARSENRDALNALLEPAIAGWGSEALIAAMEMAKLPGGRINSVPEALALPQIEARGLVREIEREDGTPVRFLGFPGQFSATPPTYRKAPPRSAEDTASVLKTSLGLDQEEIARLLAEGIIADRL
ncbi:MAG TPA: CoA transferase, partial [Novosphingobium sp.]|nr:CoA transferase [Novosphingobium sp.]